MQILKADPARFTDIPDYPFAENWVEIDLGEGHKGQMHYVDEGPRTRPRFCYSMVSQAGAFSTAR